MGGQQPIDQTNEAITRQAQDISGMLDSGDAERASEALRRASFDMEPQDFNQLVTAVEYMEQPQTGADLVMQPINPSYDRLPYSNFDGRRRRDVRHNRISETKLSMVEPDREGNLYQADIAIMRTRVQPLDAVPRQASESTVNQLTIPDQTAYRRGAELAEMIDTGYTNQALERLRVGSFNGDSGQFAREIFAASNFEYKNQGGDLTFTAVPINDDYYNRNRGFHGRHRDFWDNPIYGNQYPTTDTVVSIVAPNNYSQNGYNEFLKADIALISTSNEPLDAVRRPIN